MKKHFTAFLIAALAFAPSLFGQDANQEAPSVNVKNIDGAPINFNSTVEKGKITIVSFWATWCGPCIKELQAIDEHYADWQTKYNVKLVAVSIDDARNSRKVKPKVLAESLEPAYNSLENPFTVESNFVRLGSSGKVGIIRSQ